MRGRRNYCLGVLDIAFLFMRVMRASACVRRRIVRGGVEPRGSRLPLVCKVPRWTLSYKYAVLLAMCDTLRCASGQADRVMCSLISPAWAF